MFSDHFAGISALTRRPDSYPFMIVYFTAIMSNYISGDRKILNPVWQRIVVKLNPVRLVMVVV